VICEADAHIFYYETAAPSIISQVQLNCIPSPTGMPDLNKIENAIRPDVYYYPKTKLIALENTHNRHGGTVLDIDYIKQVKTLADKHGLRTHLDGARLWNASAATGIEMKEYAKYFDTINVCLSKGLGSPAGSLLAGTKDTIEQALKWRKILGGGMRQIGMVAKAGLFAIQNNFPKLKDDHANANLFAETINKSNRTECDLDTVQTNMVAFKCTNGLDAEELRIKLADAGILMMNLGNNSIRTVFHIQISKEDTITAANKVMEIAGED
jgi:threonine aldolase